MKEYIEIVKKIHASKYKVTFVSSGGGTNAISSLLGIPGASNTIIESYIPYSKESMDKFLNKKPDQYCSLETCLSMGANAFKKSREIDVQTKSKYLLGLAITANLSTTYKKKGDHKFFIVIQSYNYTKYLECYLEKGKRSRNEEEELITSFAISLLAQSCGIDYEMPKLDEDEKIIFDKIDAKKSWKKLFNNEVGFISNQKNNPELIFPGSFNPLHEGHKAMRDYAEEFLEKDVFFEICIRNADKPQLSYESVVATVKQFTDSCWVITRAGKFTEKSKLFPGSTFVLGIDTLIRAFDEKFYQNKDQMLEELDIFNSNNNNFLVFGREDDGTFMTLEDLNIPEHIKNRFKQVDEESFRYDISSSSLRA